MTGKKRWLLVLVALLLVFPAGMLSGEGTGKPAKQMGLTADLIKFYQTYDRMSDENWASFLKARRDELIKKFPPPPGGKVTPGPAPDKIRKKIPGEIKDFSSRSNASRAPMPLNRIFFDSGEQKRKGYSEDTYECLVSFQGNDDALKQAGAKIISSLPYKDGRIARVAVAGKKLAAVAALSTVCKMAPVMNRDLDNDLGSESTGATRLRVGTPGNWDPDRGFTGTGVVVGLIDSGIDWSHADFSDPVNGGTRIQYIWDTTVTTFGKTPADLFDGDLISGLNWGTVWTKAEIDGGTCTEYDPTSSQGHGTHTSGTAAGNGGATGLYTGMAPNADIVLVKGLTNNGILFIYEMAKLLGKPCAVNMSYGPAYPVHYECYFTDYFPQDPTDMDGQWIDALNQYYGGGHIPVKSAGNIGHWNTYTDLSGGDYPKKEGGYHWGTKMLSKTSHSFIVPDYDALWHEWWGMSPGYGDVADLILGGWLERPGNVIVTDPYGDSYEFVFGELNVFFTSDYNLVYGWISDIPEANGAYIAYFEIYPIYGYYGYSGVAVSPTMGKWKLALAPQSAGNAHADFWISDWNLYYDYIYPGIDWWTDDIYTTFTNPNVHMNVHSSYIVDEGATPFEITVGAWTTRQGWDSTNGHSYTYTKKPKLNTIADFSSPGPARDHFKKPDIAAPGQIVLSSLSSTSGVDPVYITPDNAHQAMSGTSMAAPHATGGIALLLQKFPGLTVDQVRSKLANWATKDVKTRTIGKNGFGAGKLNVTKLASLPVAVLTVDKTTLDLSKHETATFNAGGSYDPHDLPFIVKWKVLSAPDDADYKLIVDKHLYTATLIPDPDKVGTYKIGMFVDGQARDSEMATAKVKTVE
jgi:subtilisin family serine protease